MNYELTDERLEKASEYAESLDLPRSAMPPTEPVAALESIALAAMLKGCCSCDCGLCEAIKRIVPAWTGDESREDAYRMLCLALSRLP
jgi:hypothetical protein